MNKLNLRVLVEAIHESSILGGGGEEERMMLGRKRAQEEKTANINFRI